MSSWPLKQNNQCWTHLAKEYEFPSDFTSCWETAVSKSLRASVKCALFFVVIMKKRSTRSCFGLQDLSIQASGTSAFHGLCSIAVLSCSSLLIFSRQKKPSSAPLSKPEERAESAKIYFFKTNLPGRFLVVLLSFIEKYILVFILIFRKFSFKRFLSLPDRHMHCQSVRIPL